MSIHWGGRGAGHVSRWSIAPTGAPSLDLNFLSGTLDSRISFGRTSTATVINASGAIETSPINTPRFDFDPVTLAQRGLFIEEQRTNLLTTSLINGVPLVTQSVSVTAVPHTLSFYGTGTITLSGASVATVTGTGVYPNRRTITFTPILGVLVCTVVGTVQFAQLEVGAFATSFIPTAGSAVTRSSDNATMTGANFSSWYNQSQGTFLANFTPDEGLTNNGSRVLSTTSGGVSNRVSDIGITGANWINFNGTNSTVIGAASVTSVPQRIAAAYATANYGYVLNGGTVATDSSALVNSPTQLSLGQLSSTSYLNGHIRSIKYFKTRLLNNQLQALTA